MILLTQTPNKKATIIIKNILEDIVDLYSDVYITMSNVRIGIRENSDIMFRCLKQGDKIAYDEDGKGLAFITGWSDDNNRKYVKVLSREEKVVDRILKTINWQINSDLYVKIKKNNRFLKTFQRNFYKFVGDRGQEVLLCRKFFPKKDYTYAILKEKGDLENSIDIYYRRKK